MFPLHDNIPPRTFPWVTYGIIVACSLAFFYQLSEGESEPNAIQRWGMIPAHVTQAIQVSSSNRGQAELVNTPFGPALRVEHPSSSPQSRSLAPWMTIITCMFLHGGLLHFAGNMWFLHIFGDNVEDRLGHSLYLLLYLGTGIVAGLAHLFSDPSSTIPTIGASGAIAGVMGAYILLYPKAMVETLIPLPILFTTFSVPAPIFLGVWFLIQVAQGMTADNSGGGVAWWAHAGGFVAGLGLAMLLVSTRIARPPVTHYR